MGDDRSRMKLELPEDVIRAIRARAGFDNINPADVVTAACELYLREELAMVRARMTAGTGERPKAKPRRGRKSSE